MPDTVRNVAVAALKSTLLTMKKGEPASDPYTVEWDGGVRRGNITLATGRQYACGITEPTETTLANVNTLTERTLTVAVEWEQLLQKDDEAGVELNRVLGEIQRKVAEDETLGNTVKVIEEVRNEFDYDLESDRRVQGVIFYEMQFRHRIKDPRLET